MGVNVPTVQERFWEKVIKLPEPRCWLWAGTRSGKNYGVGRLDGKTVLAHRLAWIFTFGDVEEGMCVCHGCDNPLCVNPAHLFLGDNATNMKDKIKKGRQRTRSWLPALATSLPESERIIGEWRKEEHVRRFWRKVNKTDTCWLWNASKSTCGYGKFTARRLGHHCTGAHRFAWEISFGEIPEGLLVLHCCDTPACVRPDHLFLGTPADNMLDKVQKGRQSKGPQHAASHASTKGERNGNSRLTWEIVRQIRAEYTPGMGYKNVANRYNVSPGMIAFIIRGESWKPEDDPCRTS
jgi:hypothetical protein